jgi:hypothetical protein
MAPPNRVLRPDAPDLDMGDVRRRLFALETAGVNPTVRAYNESVDNAHPMDIDFVIPNNIQIPLAKLSFHFKPYRTTSSFAGGNTGAGTSHLHNTGSETGHSHSHSHGLTPLGSFNGVTAVWWDGLVPQLAQAGTQATDNTSIGSNAAGSSGHNHGNTGGEASHTHSIGASTLGVSEGTSTTISALAVDGVDKTSTLGGPWTVDTVDLDISKVLPLGDGLWHKVTLTPVAQGRIVVELKVSI